MARQHEPTAESAAREVVVTRVFDAPAEDVFDAWLDADVAGRWFFATPDGEMQTVEIDPRVGGTFRIVEKRGEELADHFGTYVELDRPRRLVFTFATNVDERSSRVSVVIKPLEQGCEVTLTHQLLPGWEGFADQARTGWTMILDNLTSALSDAREIIITRTFDAPRELVWRAWTEPALIGRWWGPRGFDTRVEKHELRAGGQWRYVMVGPDGHEYPAIGTFSEVSPMDRFVTTSEFGEDFIARSEMDLPKGAMLTVTFEDFDEKTRVTLRMTHRSAGDRRKHEEMGVVPGWNSSLECLDELLDKIA